MTLRNNASADDPAARVQQKLSDLAAEIVADVAAPFSTITVIDDKLFVRLEEAVSTRSRRKLQAKVALTREPSDAASSDPDDEALKSQLKLARALLLALTLEMRPAELKQYHRKPQAQIWHYAEIGGFRVDRETVTKHVNISQGKIPPNDRVPIGSIRNVLATHERIILGVLKGKYQLTGTAIASHLPESIAGLGLRHNIEERHIRAFLRKACENHLSAS